MTANTTLRRLQKESKARFQAASETIPADVIEEIKNRAFAGVNSGEPHKATGGWVLIPFTGKGFNHLGLLEVASNAIKNEQQKSFCS
tara:strand:- start:531 stop:791 length:261 start_codon:yes stop_codon:yes gene_type:complete